MSGRAAKRTRRAIVDEKRRKRERAIVDAAREHEALATSPHCMRDSIVVDGAVHPLRCRDELAYHDPCSRCPCPSFVGDRPRAGPPEAAL